MKLYIIRNKDNIFQNSTISNKYKKIKLVVAKRPSLSYNNNKGLITKYIMSK